MKTSAFEIPMHPGSALAINLDQYFSEVVSILDQPDSKTILKAADSLKQIITITSRADFKKTIVETMLHFYQAYGVHANHPEVDKKMLSRLLRKISYWIDFLETNEVKHILETVLSASYIMKYCSNIPESTRLHTDMVYSSWQRLGLSSQLQHLKWVLSQLAPIHSLVSFLCQLLRQERPHKSYQTLDTGYYHHSVPQQKLFYVSLKLESAANIYPEISLVSQKLLIYFHELIVTGDELTTTPVKTGLTFSMMFS